MDIYLGASEGCAVSPTYVTFMKMKFKQMGGGENSGLKLDGKHARSTSFCRRLGRYAEIRGTVRII